VSHCKRSCNIGRDRPVIEQHGVAAATRSKLHFVLETADSENGFN
jgi:hypothetical protein